MHRHGYKGRKFGRENDQRQALLRGLMVALVEHQSIKTTLAKAKEVRPAMEKLVTLAKKGGLANRRLVIARLNSVEMGNILLDVVAPQIKRDSGYLRITRENVRVGDNAPMATIAFVDSIQPLEKPASAKSGKKVTAKTDKTTKSASKVSEEKK